MRVPFLALAAVALLLFAACGGSEEPTGAGPTSSGATQADAAPPLPQGSEPVELDPANFVSTIDNPWWPMARGSRWVYRETDKDEVLKVVVTVTDRTKSILGIPATVVRDVVSQDGEVHEDTYDWYAQDRWGNVWYLGEDTKEFDKGKVSTEGSWEAGVDGAQAGIVVPANPEVGLGYRQEYYAGEAEDHGEVLSLSEQADVPFGSFQDVLETKDWTPLEPDVVEHKFYAQGVGQVLAVQVSGGSSREVLLSFEPGP